MASASQDKLSEVHRTAFYAAAMRAGHFLQGAEPKIFRDEFALRLTDMTAEEAVAFTARVPQSSASTAVLRSRFTEDRLAAARERLHQYVVLGAGLDSYALRMGDGLGSMIVYEIDDPPFQTWKRQRIETLGLKVPQQLRFVPCDFERMSIDRALAESGFAANEPCFTSWLGVTQYLTREAIRETLRWAARRPSGSEIVLTFVEPQAEAERRASPRNPVTYLSYFSEDEMTLLLKELGFSRIENLTRTGAQTYFQHRSDGLIVPEFQRVVSAIV
jgi:methyltransferase (TIGR00027 family)